MSSLTANLSGKAEGRKLQILRRQEHSGIV